MSDGEISRYLSHQESYRKEHLEFYSSPMALVAMVGEVKLE